MIKIKGLWVCLILCNLLFGGNSLAQIPDDPVSCDGIITFEQQAVYLRHLYVDPSGSDSTGDGSESEPFASLSGAASVLQPGDTVHVGAGTYPVTPYLENIQGTELNPIRITGPEAGEAIFSGSSEGLHLIDARYMVLENLTIDGPAQNGLNIDDGGTYETPSEYIVIKGLKVRNIGSGGNNDGIKLSGVDHFYLLDNELVGGSDAGGSGVDMVGCHDGIIAGNLIEQFGSNLVQAKGGTERVAIHGNILKNADERGVNMGGSTSAPYFRPSIADGTDFEARHIRVTANVISGANAGVAFVGCVECLAAHNLIYKPNNWTSRILQETTTLDGVDFQPSSDGVFENNIVVFESSISTLVNVGDNTAPDTFVYRNNIFYCADDDNYNYESWRAELPGTDERNLRQYDPQLIDADAGDFHIGSGSPAVDAAVRRWVDTDYSSVCNPDAIGPFEYLKP